MSRPQRGTAKKQGGAPPKLIQQQTIVQGQGNTTAQGQDKPENTICAELAKSENVNDLDKYLALEFPDDTQTNKATRVLANYLKDVFPQATTPKAMRAEIDAVDVKSKAYYLLTLIRANVKGTLLSSKDNNPATLTTADFVGMSCDAVTRDFKIQKIVDSLRTDLGHAGWPWPSLKKPATDPEFVFSDDMLMTISEKVTDVLNKAKNSKGEDVSLFKTNRTPAKNVREVLLRMGSYYGLQRIVDELERKEGFVPDGDDNTSRSDEHIVERNLYRFALFGPQNKEFPVFKVTENNIAALEYAFREKSTFSRTDFPEQLKLAVKPFFVQAAQKLTDAGKNIGAGLKEYLNKFAPEMSDAQKTKEDAAQKAILAAAADVNRPEEKRQMDPGPTPFQPMPAPPAVKDAAAAAAEAEKKAAENISANEQGRSTDADVIPKEANCQALINQLKQYESQVASLEEALKTYGETSDNAATLIGEQQTLINTLSDLKEKTGTSVDNISKLQAQLNECNGAKTALDLKIKELEDKVANLLVRIGVLTQTINSLQGKLSEIEILLFKVAAQQAAATDEDAVEKLRDLKLQLENRAEAIRVRIDELVKQQEGLEAEKKKCQETITAGQGELDIIDKTRKQITAELDECKAGRAALLESYRVFCVNQADALTRVNALLSAATKSMEVPLSKLQQAIAKGREEYTSRKASLDQFLAKGSSVKEYTKELGDLEASFTQPATKPQPTTDAGVAAAVAAAPPPPTDIPIAAPATE